MLQIFRVGDTPQLSVYAKRLISKRTQFGPFVGEIVDSMDKITNKNFPIQVIWILMLLFVKTHK